LYSDNNNIKTNTMKTQLIQDLNNTQKQLNYTNNALTFNLENWERKEFEQVKKMLLLDIESLTNRIEFLS
jgi:hypothetical protein